MGRSITRELNRPWRKGKGRIRRRTKAKSQKGMAFTKVSRPIIFPHHEGRKNNRTTEKGKEKGRTRRSTTHFSGKGASSSNDDFLGFPTLCIVATVKFFTPLENKGREKEDGRIEPGLASAEGGRTVLNKYSSIKPSKKGRENCVRCPRRNIANSRQVRKNKFISYARRSS